MKDNKPPQAPSLVDAFMLEEVSFIDVKTSQNIDLKTLNMGVTQFDEFFVWQDDKIIKVFDRACDHSGGKLISRGNAIQCPLHGWALDPQTGKYKNVDCTKLPLAEFDRATATDTLTFESSERRRCLKNFPSDKPVEITFLNHACLIISSGDFKIATDPWILGPAFCNGWWLAQPSPEDSFEQLNACDLLYISHNHPDHLHPESLSHIRKDMPILTANFQSGSTARYMQSLGFDNILTADFDKSLVLPEREISLSILKSGDFRDDSGLLIEIGAFSALLSVDSNYIDFWRLPPDITLLCSSFAGGASSFPLSFDNYTEEEKKRILGRNRNAIKATNALVLDRTTPSYFMPYAGFFTEDAERDSYIKTNNKKNAVRDYEPLAASRRVSLLDVQENDQFEFLGAQLKQTAKKAQTFLVNKSIDSYIKQAKVTYSAGTDHEISCYFEKSGFQGDLLVLISLCDDGFETTRKQFSVDFREMNNTEVQFFEPLHQSLPPLTSFRDAGTHTNILHLKIREEAFFATLREGLPWEDLSIGFQMRVVRDPNVYNSDFWFHFTNIYVKDYVVKASQNCTACAAIDQGVY